MQVGGPIGFVNLLDNWYNGAPIVGFGDGLFNCWWNGAPYVDLGGASILPISCTGTCIGTGFLVAAIGATGKAGCKGTGLLTATGRLAGSGSGGCKGTGAIRGAASISGSGTAGCKGTGAITGQAHLTGSGTGTCSGGVSAGGLVVIFGSGTGGCLGTGILTGTSPPAPSAHRRVSPTQPSLRAANFAGEKWWSRRVSPKSERQRILT